MEIKQIQREIVDEFSWFDSWQDKYQYIIDLGRALPVLSAQYKKDDFLIKGCQSLVWLYPEFKDGKVWFHADSDAIITKGIIALLVRVFSGQTPGDILSSNLDFIEEIKLNEYLSPTRANGLASMIEQIKLYALAYSKMSDK